MSALSKKTVNRILGVIFIAIGAGLAILSLQFFSGIGVAVGVFLGCVFVTCGLLNLITAQNAAVLAFAAIVETMTL